MNCLRRGRTEIALNTHREWRKKLGLPMEVPRGGVKCKLCVNECEVIDKGYCGVIVNDNGKLVPKIGVTYYYDPHPTNCVAEPVCPERTNIGHYNLAVFFHGCNLDCLFCQNIEHKTIKGWEIGIEELVRAVLNPKVTCICYFGGDPAPFSPYAIRVAQEILKKKKIRICWETNGLENPRIMRRIARLSEESGGIVKIDWKAYSPEVYEALTGINGKKAVERIKENIRVVIEEGAMLVVSTLVVPHYIDEREVNGITKFLASISDEMPYVLLAFHPHHLMSDIPTTSWEQMNRLVEVARKNGLKNVFVGNYWLLRVKA